MKFSKETITTIEQKIGYTFTNKHLLEQAFTRSSYCNEHSVYDDNEVLEFIGDSVLGMLVVKRLAERYRMIPAESSVDTEMIKQLFENDPLECERVLMSVDNFTYTYINECSEAELSEMKIELVQRASLAKAIEESELAQYLLVGKSDEKNGVRYEASVQEDLLEAIIGAVTLDSSWDLATIESILHRLVRVDERLEKGHTDSIDYEAKLNEDYPDAAPVVEAALPLNDILTHGCSVTVSSNFLRESFYGYGSTKEGARRHAFKRAYLRCSRIGDLATRVQNAIGKPDFTRAVNQLQELYQKKIISEPIYEFNEETKSDSGNPRWGCSCIIPGSWEMNGSYIADSKGEAKKMAAYETLLALQGYDISRMFTEYGTPINK